MALEVRADYPDIDFDRSWFVGDSASDLEFANRAGIPAFLVQGEQDLLAFARQTIQSVNR
jgi:histidinol phosphatase-like enzyme